MIELEQLSALRMARYEFQLQATDALVLQPLLGSTLRGAFGHAWKTLACLALPEERAARFLH